MISTIHIECATLLLKVRASAVFALGRLIANTGDRSDHANMVDHGTATTLASIVGQDGSPLVRKVAFHWFFILFNCRLFVSLHSHSLFGWWGDGGGGGCVQAQSLFL